MISINPEAWGKGVWLRASRSRPRSMKGRGNASGKHQEGDMGLETQLDHSNRQSCPEGFTHFSEGRGYQFSRKCPRSALSFFCRSMVIQVSNPSLGSAPRKSVCGSSRSQGYAPAGPPLITLLGHPSGPLGKKS